MCFIPIRLLKQHDYKMRGIFRKQPSYAYIVQSQCHHGELCFVIDLLFQPIFLCFVSYISKIKRSRENLFKMKNDEMCFTLVHEMI